MRLDALNPGDRFVFSRKGAGQKGIVGEVIRVTPCSVVVLIPERRQHQKRRIVAYIEDEWSRSTEVSEDAS